jgi:ABC-type multidrug transport system fused ATPase/permease subunit
LEQAHTGSPPGQEDARHAEDGMSMQGMQTAQAPAVAVPIVAAGLLSPEQLTGEQLSNDPEWEAQLCWPRAYMRMHHLLLVKAKEIEEEGQQTRTSAEVQRGQGEPTISESLKMLRKEVFSLCPMHLLGSGMCVSVVLTVLSFLQPYFQGKLVDIAVDAFNKGQTEDIWPMLMPGLTWVALSMVGSYLCEIVVGILFAVCGHTTVTRLRIKLFRNLTEQDIAFYDCHVSGELSSRLINDSAALSSLTQFTTQTMLGAIVKFVGSLVAMYWTHPELALLSTIITPVNTLLVRKTGKTVGHYGVVQNHAMAKANGVAIEVLGSIRTVQSNVGEHQEASRFMDRLNYYLRIIKATVYIETVLRFTQFGLSKIRNVVVLAYAMHQVINGKLSIGAYTAFNQYINLYEDGFKNLADIWVNFKQTITSTGKFVQLLLREPGIPVDGGQCLAECSGHLAMEDVDFAYSGRPDHLVLSKVNFVARPGDIIALVGESGAGKTTIGRLLLRYYDPRDGRIALDGVDARELNLRWLRSQIGFVEQEPVLFDRPMHENIAYGSARGRPIEDVHNAARKANAHDFVTLLKDGYETHPGERASRISGGQKQRVAIARAIIRAPKVLLLDEATSALDSENEHIVQEALDKLMIGKTTVIIAHRLSTVVRATRILVLDKGRVIEQGTHDELVAADAKYASFMKHQMVAPLLE